MVDTFTRTLAWVFLSLIAGSVYLWARALRKVRRGEPMLPLEPRTAVPWGLLELLMIVISTIVLISLAMAAVRHLLHVPLEVAPKELTADQLAGALLADGVGKIVALTLAVIVLLFRGATWRDLGWSAKHFWGDLKIGVATFVMVAPPMYIMQGVLKYFIPSEHPVESLLEKGFTPLMFAVAAFTAAIVAPLAEELVFRVLLQGWLENWASPTVAWSRIVLGKTDDDFVVETPSNVLPEERSAEDYHIPEMPRASSVEDTYAPAIGSTMAVKAAQVEMNLREKLHIVPARWPLLVSAVIFAALHGGDRPDPVPLFFLAAGIGYVYWKTHRIVPCIVVHLLVNSLSLIAMAVHFFGRET